MAESEVNLTASVVEIASQTGRLDFVSALLAIVAILMALAGVLAYFDLRNRVRRDAEVVAKNVAEDIAEKEAVAYLEKEIPALIREYEQLAANAMSGEVADRIARAQEDGTEDEPDQAT